MTTASPQATATMARRALPSVSDKTGLLSLAQQLHSLGWELLSTGGTAKHLRDQGLPITDVASITGLAEMLDGRVKTLHPAVHGGILARRDRPEHMAALAQHGFQAIDLVVVNLYPFQQATAKAGIDLETAIENIDIGGPAMVRAAAKNNASVTVVVDPADYGSVITQLSTQGDTTPRQRLDLAAKAYAHTSAYDGAIAALLTSIPSHDAKLSTALAPNPFPERFSSQLVKTLDMRYGENPHQSAAFYRTLDSIAAGADGSIAAFVQHQGKALSYNNIADADTAWECVKTLSAPACVIVKHANPCGVAVADTIASAYLKALKTDTTSAFGGIVAVNRELDEDAAKEILKIFVEVVIAPSVDPLALALFSEKPNIRILSVPGWQGSKQPSASSATSAMSGPFRLSDLDCKRVGGGLLLQTPDHHELKLDQCQIVSRKQPSQAELQDMLFAWQVAKFVKSNAIVFCHQGMTLGIGAGQMSRVDSARIAAIKAANAGLSLQNAAVASDAFFPFRDGLDVVVDHGARCIIQPGGSIRDDEVIAAANERDVVMMFTGVRHFRH